MILGFLGAVAVGLAQPPTNRYALILEDPAASERFTGRAALQSAEALDYRRQIEARQQAVRQDLATRNIRVTGSVFTVLNAVFVAASTDREAELRSLSGVKGVVALRRIARNLNKAMPLLDVPAAWNALGGIQTAGAGIKIAILDSGIDQTHAMLQDSSLTVPAGFPKCNVPSDCANFTNSKVIVARSYVPLMVAGSNAANPAADSRPDDLSARDRDGHGTSVAATAAGNNVTGALNINGVAPKAYLGNYKIYGSPGVNDFPPIDIPIKAIEDALNDGMDVVSFSSGYPALTGPLDTGAACGNPTGVPCDLLAQAFEKAAQAGMIVVASAGNDGYSGYNYPVFNTVESPADAPSVIAVGGTTNAHNFFETVSVPGGPPNLQGMVTATGDANVFYPGAATFPLIDVTQLGDNGLLCSPLPDVGLGLLYGYIALIERGTCNFSVKVLNAQNAGAEAVILYMADQSALLGPGGLSNYIPTVMISNTDGVNLKNFVDASPLHLVTIDPAGSEQADTTDQNLLVGYSSNGPSTGDSLVKPEIVAVAGDPSFFNYIYTAAETYDPAGELYSSTGYAVSAGTSYSAPMVAGAAALVKQRHPNYTAAQIRSALINTATQDVQTDDSSPASGLQFDNIPVDVQWLGAGKLDAGAALSANVAVSPTTLSFGLLSALPITKPLQFTNTGSSSVNLSLTSSVYPGETSSALVSFDHSSLTLAAGASATVNVTLSGTVPPQQEYSGVITVQGSGVPLKIPYMYIVPDNTPANLFPLGGDFDGVVGQGPAPIPALPSPLAVKLTDDYGAPIAGRAVTFTTFGGSSIQNADQVTNKYGIAQATPVLGSTPGNYTFRVTTGGMSQTVTGYARQVPAITTVENGASFDPSKPVAPGSYITIKGTGLSDYTDGATTARLPLQIDYVTVSFDVPSAGISLPGYPTYVSTTQVNVWVPWELRNQNSVQVKVTINYTPGNVVTVPFANYSPAFFIPVPADGIAAALDLNYVLITTSHPAVRGQVVQLYANGLGPVTNQPPSGDPALASPLSETTTKCTASIGGQPATVGFCGLASGFPGLYQANVTVPTSLAPGTYPVTITVGGQTSPPANLPVQ